MFVAQCKQECISQHQKSTTDTQIAEHVYMSTVSTGLYCTSYVIQHCTWRSKTCCLLYLVLNQMSVSLQLLAKKSTDTQTNGCWYRPRHSSTKCSSIQHWTGASGTMCCFCCYEACRLHMCKLIIEFWEYWQTSLAQCICHQQPLWFAGIRVFKHVLSSQYIHVSSDGQVCTAPLVFTFEGTMPEQKQRLKSLHICKAFVLGIVAIRQNCTTGPAWT